MNTYNKMATSTENKVVIIFVQQGSDPKNSGKMEAAIKNSGH